MKRFFVNTLLVAFAAITMSACKSFNTLSSGETAQGRPYELILVCGQPQWQSELGDTLRYFLQQPVAELPTYEPMFDVMRIMPNNFKSLTHVLRRNSLVKLINFKTCILSHCLDF